VPAPIRDILAEADRLLEPARFSDFGPNGLQVPGPHDASVVASAVSANAETFEKAADMDTDLLLVHHGLFWPAAGPLDHVLKRRLQLLFDADIALAAYHLPLDAHPEIGNNALLARALGAAGLTPFADHKGQPIGFLAELPGDGLTATDLQVATEQVTNHPTLAFLAGPERIARIGIVTGGGADYLPDAAEAGADAFITGEVPERSMALAQEHSIHLIAAGHYATETFGIKRLGETLAERFGLQHVFIDVPNPI
jgi:dinuclear metal center YbgI/SA1388 family protein